MFFFQSCQVLPSTVKLLTDSQLIELGVKMMGDRASIREACSKSARSKCHSYSM